MISFASLFVGLVFGLVNVELVAAQGVARVDLLLDGRAVAELREPWGTTLDLGCTPAPHELVAVAYDGKGKEVERVRQWVNRPRSIADASLLLEPRVPGSPRVARLSWRSLSGEVPTSVVVTLDETGVPVADPARFELPPHDPGRSHTLRATLAFPRDVVATAEAHFGGTRRSEAFQEMTAVAIELPKGKAVPPPEELTGWFEKDGMPLEIAAVEEGPYDVVFVCEASALPSLRSFFRGRKGRPLAPRPSLPEDFRFRFLWPVGSMSSQRSMVSNTYPVTRRRTVADGSLAWQATEQLVWPDATEDGQRLADAVAVAALAAADEERRRAVVLVLGPEAKEGSLLGRNEAASFLSDLGVPLHVWSVGASASHETNRWKGVTRIRDGWQLASALEGLLARLERQRIVWVEGSHLPQSIVLAPRAGAVRPAGSTPRP